MSSLYPPSTNNNPSVLKKGRQLDSSYTEMRDSKARTLKIPDPSGEFKYVDNEFVYYNPKIAFPYKPVQGFPADQSLLIQQVELLDDTIKELNELYPFTYNIPDEKKFAVWRQMVDNQGIAQVVDSRTGNYTPIGKMYVPPDYYTFVKDLMDREEAKDFKAFVFNNMDISDPVKKDYWKKKNPELFNELMQGYNRKEMLRYLMSYITLKGPETEEEWKFLYNYGVLNRLTQKDVKPDKNYPPNLPYSLPYPRGSIVTTQPITNFDRGVNLGRQNIPFTKIGNRPLGK